MMIIKPLLAALLASAFAGPALAINFTGPAQPANFAITDTGTPVGTTNTGTATFGNNQLVLIGSDSTGGCTGGTYSVLGPCALNVTLATAGTYTFNWSYVTADNGGPAGDMFGVLVDGHATTLSDLGGAIGQTGTATFAASSSFGWFINCTDCTSGFAAATISSFSLTPAVPEPETLALMLAGVGVVGVLKRRRVGRG